MKNITAEPDDFIIYCTDADSAEHSLRSVSEADLLRQLKLCSWLGRHVYVSAGHVYENPATAQVLRDNPDLLRSALVVLGLRDDCRDFNDLLDLRASQGKKNTAEDRELSVYLDTATTAVMRWTTAATQTRFRHFLLQSIRDSGSILRRRLHGVRKTAIANLEAELAGLAEEEVTRTVLQHLARKYTGRHNAIIREANLLYYAAGSTDRVLQLSTPLFSDLRVGYFESLRPAYSKLPLDELLMRVFREMRVPAEMVTDLSVPALIEFREKYARQLRRFRCKWWSSISEVGRTGHASGEAESAEEEIAALVGEFHREQHAIRAYDQAARWVNVSSLAVSAASIVAAPVVSALSFFLSLVAYAAGNETVKHSILGTHLTALTTCLQRHHRGDIAPADH